MDFKTGYAFINMDEYNNKMEELKYKKKEIDEALENFKTVHVYRNRTDSSFYTNDEIIKEKLAEIDEEKAKLKKQMKKALVIVKQLMSKRQWKLFTNTVEIEWEPDSTGWDDYV